VPGKYGWIADGRSGSAGPLTFVVPSRVGSIQLGYLRSYTGMGMARVRADRLAGGGVLGAGNKGWAAWKGKEITLDGLWTEPVSIMKHARLGVPVPDKRYNLNGSSFDVLVSIALFPRRDREKRCEDPASGLAGKCSPEKNLNCKKCCKCVGNKFKLLSLVSY
jgi:hypothetical protein